MTEIKQLLDMVKTCVEIIAIVIAGIWAAVHFNAFESTELNTRAAISGDVDWRPTPDKRCFGQIHLKVQNLGKHDFKVDSFRVTVRQFSLPTRPAVITPLTDKNMIPVIIFDTAYTKGALITNYTQSRSSTQSFSYLVDLPRSDRLEWAALVFLTDQYSLYKENDKVEFYIFPCPWTIALDEVVKVSKPR